MVKFSRYLLADISAGISADFIGRFDCRSYLKAGSISGAPHFMLQVFWWFLVGPYLEVIHLECNALSRSSTAGTLTLQPSGVDCAILSNEKGRNLTTDGPRKYILKHFNELRNIAMHVLHFVLLTLVVTIRLSKSFRRRILGDVFEVWRRYMCGRRRRWRRRKVRFPSR